MRIGTHNGHLMVAALRRHHDKPVIHLGDISLTGREVSERMSQYVQAFESLGAGQGSAGALLALNRPEVLFILGASQTQGYRRTSLHPLGSADDHAYVINDAEITTITIDPVFTERALALLEKCPNLKQVLTIGPVPEALAHVGTDLVEEAAKFEPQPLEAKLLPRDHMTSITYTGGTTGNPKGVIGRLESFSTMTNIQLAEWEWPENAALPGVHAAVARRGRVLRPHADQGRVALRGAAPKFDPGEVLRSSSSGRSGSTATMLVPTMLYALLDHPDSHGSGISPAWRPIYYGASPDQPGAAASEAIDRFGPIFAQFYGQSEAPMVDHATCRSRTASRRATSGSPRAAGRPRSCGHGAARRATATGSPHGRAGRDLRGRARCSPAGYWKQARPDCRDVPRRLDAHR